MIRIRGPDHVGRIGDPDIRRLVKERIDQVINGDKYDPEIHGEFTVVETGDSIDSLEEESGCPLTTSPFTEARYPDPEFAPIWEALLEHETCYELVFIFTDDGAGVSMFVPKSMGINAELLALCARYGEPVPAVVS